MVNGEESEGAECGVKLWRRGGWVTHLKDDSNRVVIYGDGNLPNQVASKRTEAEANTYKNKGYEMGSIILLLSAWRQIIFVDECLTLTKDIRSKVKSVGVVKSDETEAFIMECCCVRSPSYVLSICVLV